MSPAAAVVACAVLISCWTLHGLCRTRRALAIAQQALEKAAICPVTGLPTRMAWLPQAEAAIADGAVTELAFLDLDGFKRINDRFGHPVGDAVLAAVAQRLRVELPDALVGNAGGDEMVVLTQRPANWDAVARELTQPLVEAGAIVVFGVSVGVTTAVHGARLSELLTRADSAMYDAKRSGGGVQWAAEHVSNSGASTNSSEAQTLEPCRAA